MIRIGYGWLVVLGLLLTNVGAYAQASAEIFGKNRIQYQRFNWQYLSSPNFDVYYYDGGEEIAQNGVQIAEREFNRITELFGSAPYSKIKLFIYNSMADLQQSNVGLDAENAVADQGVAQAFLFKSIVEVPFPGNQADYRREIAHGIARTLVHDMMYGGSFRDMLQSSYLMSLPDWFVLGAARYAAEGWDQTMDDHLRDLVLTSKMRKPTRLMGEEAAIAGQSFWNYIAEVYGVSNVANILNLTRIIRNEETSIASTIGVPYNRVIRDWRSYYLTMASNVSDYYEVPPDSARAVRGGRRQRPVFVDLAYSPRGTHLAYVQVVQGLAWVKLLNLKTGRRRTLHRFGYKTLQQRSDYTSPQLAWTGDQQLMLVHSHRGKLKAIFIDADKFFAPSTSYAIKGIEHVSDVAVSPDRKTAVFSADRRGQNDLYLYDLRRKGLRQLTDTPEESLQPAYLPDGSGVVFSSDRRIDSTTVSLRPELVDYNLFLLSFDDDSLRQLTRAPYRETHPQPLGNGSLLYLSDARGILNLFRYDLATGESTQLTKYRQDVQLFDYANGQLAAVMYHQGRHHIYTPAFDLDAAPTTRKTRRRMILDDQYLGIALEEDAESPDDFQTLPLLPADTALSSEEINIDYYVFESEKNAAGQPEVPASSLPASPLAAEPTLETPDVMLEGPFPYRNRLTMQEINSTLAYNPLPSVQLGLRFQGGLTDLFENHKFTGDLIVYLDGFRSSFMQAEYSYLKHRLDYHVTYEKTSYFIATDASVFGQRHTLTRVAPSVSYPFTTAARVALTGFFARTTFTQYEVPIPGGSVPPQARQNYFGGRLEYTYDNTVSKGLNVLLGSRARVSFEQYLAAGNSSLNFSNLSADFRHYQPIFREVVLATRLSYGGFFGNSKKFYMLGGMDNWLFASREQREGDDSDPLTTTGSAGEVIDLTDWLFHRFATNLRGFPYNAAFGNSHLLLNAEFRLPIVRALYRGPIQSNFFRNLQFIAFADIGSAWSGRNPFTLDNSINTRVQDADNNFDITVVNYRNPFLSGYGAGVRTVLLGYFARFDVAWGVQEYEVLDPRFYLTFGYDF